MIARDPDEVTVIVEESAILESRALETDGGYRILEIKVATGFESVGFLATVTRALAEAGVSILVVSTYSKDYVLVKEESVAAGLKALSGIGFGFAGV
jgi:hypothetical protein